MRAAMKLTRIFNREGEKGEEGYMKALIFLPFLPYSTLRLKFFFI
jgi:hypothetical protein